MRKPNPTPRPTPPPPQPDITIIKKGKPMSKLIILFVLFILALQPIPPCGKLDRRRYIVAPICEPQPVKPPSITIMH